MIDKTYASLPIIWDGHERGRDGGDPLSVFKIHIDNTWTWFIANTIFHSNENEFDILIDSFGLVSKSAAGSTGHEFRIKFNSSNHEHIKKRLFDFFTGHEDKPFPPFMIPQAKCKKVSFAAGWILQP